MPDRIETALGPLLVRPATVADSEAFAAILHEAQAWLEQQHTGQWVPGAHDPSLIDRMIAQGTGYLVEYDGRLIATCRLTWTLPAHWQNALANVGYLGTLNVEREYAGFGIGRAIIGWAESQMHQRGRQWSCLDCLATNTALAGYYERLGYTAIGDVETYPGYAERMFRKRL